jgi:hypothetical protein
LIRRAKATDIPAMVGVIREGANRSIEANRLTFDETAVKQLLMAMVNQSARNWVAVSDNDGVIEGLLAGTTMPVYHVAEELEATDVFWIATEACPVRDRILLMTGFIDWAKAHKRIVRIQCGVTNIIQGSERAGKILERSGFDSFGHLYRMEVHH